MSTFHFLKEDHGGDNRRHGTFWFADSLQHAHIDGVYRLCTARCNPATVALRQGFIRDELPETPIGLALHV